MTDDRGTQISFSEPPSRVVSLSPHITELVYSLGAQDQLVAVSEYSDFPPEALSKPVAGGYGSVNAETLMSFRPDLILAWPDNASAAILQRLEKRGVPVLRSDPRTFADIANNLRWIGCALGRPDRGEALAKEVEDRTEVLRAEFSGRSTVRVFYQLGAEPLMSQNSTTFIHQAITLCGGENLFADAIAMAPLVSKEGVIALNPDVIITADDGSGMPLWLAGWQSYPMMKAVKNDRLMAMNADLLFRPTLRFLEGAEELCRLIDSAR